MFTIRYAAVAVVAMLFSSSLSAATFTVSKRDGKGQFTSIQSAINAAGPGDEVVIVDYAVYAEQVTIDSTKNGLVLRSYSPRNSGPFRPTILFQDRINVGPTNKNDALIDSMITFDRNGALQILGAADVRIEGIIIDGGGVFPFGYDAIWEGRYPVQHGNAGISIWRSGEVMILGCDISNAYFGINVKDRNDGGIYANPNPADIYPWNVIPFSGFARTGNHLFEYNRIHNNSVGMFFESTWDLGSTLRYNLFYGNHHPTAAIATNVKELTSEGGNQTGGALMFKDQMLSPLAIYNNTFWRNSLIFTGNWKSGGQHLVFNNIFAGPNDYWGGSSTTFSTSFEMSKCFANRMHNCVYAAQDQSPTPSCTTITPYLKPIMAADSTCTQGALIQPFPASAEIRWVETQMETELESNNVWPDRNDARTNEYIVDQGWEAAGKKDPDGSRADLGSAPSAGGRSVDVVTIRPTVPVMINGATATIGFNVTPRIGTMKDPRIVYLCAVTKLDTSDVFGSAYKPIPAVNIQNITLPSTSIEVGANTLEVPIPSGGMGDFGFFEMVIEGTGSEGHPFTSAVGFIPYRKLEYMLDVAVLDKVGGTAVTTVRAGQPVVLEVKPRRLMEPFSNKVDPTSVNLQSRFVLQTPAGVPVIGIPGGITGTATTEVVFTRVPTGGVEFVQIAGKWISTDRVIGFVGCSQGVKVLAGPVERIEFERPASTMTEIIIPRTTFPVKVQAFDKYDNPVDSACAVKVVSIKPEIGTITDTIQNTTADGISTYQAVVTSGAKDQIFPMVASLVSNPTACDTAYLKVGESVQVIPPSLISTKPRQLLYELIDLRGRVMKRQCMAIAGRDSGRFTATISRGFYLLRTTDIATGKVTMRKRVVLGR